MNINSPFSEHKDRRNNFYYNVLLKNAGDIPLADDYSEDSFPNSDEEQKELDENY